MSQTVDIRELNERIESKSSFVNMITMGMDKVIVGQKHLVESLLIGLLSDGHILLEGVPGLAKTLAIKTLSSLIDAKYSRIQFTPDLLPADVIGTMIYSQKSEEFQVKQGPIFANFVLADEINRAPAKVQSALLEAMQERQVTISEHTYKLPKPFLVMEFPLLPDRCPPVTKITFLLIAFVIPVFPVGGTFSLVDRIVLARLPKGGRFRVGGDPLRHRRFAQCLSELGA